MRAYAINSKGTGYSNDMSFSTVKYDNDIWDGSVATSFGGGVGTSQSPILIESCAQLKLLADNVNKGISDYNDIFFQLTSNLDLNNINWAPIGIDYKIFKGNFDGNGCVIKNLLVESKDQHDSGGLFGEAYANISNLTVYGKVDVSAYYDGVGGICGILEGSISNCTNYCDITGASYSRCWRNCWYDGRESNKLY